MLEMVVSCPEYIRINSPESDESVLSLKRSSISLSKNPDFKRFISVVCVLNLNQDVVNVSNAPPGLITSRAHSGTLYKESVNFVKIFHANMWIEMYARFIQTVFDVKCIV